MTVSFYGKWSLEVVANVNEFPQRLRITGSAASDGVVSGAVGTIVASIDGAAWKLSLERSEDGGVTWIENIENALPSVTPLDGWIVTVYGDDGIVLPVDADISVKLVYLNPVVNPPPYHPIYSFTLPPQDFRPPSPVRRECECCRPKICSCGQSRLPPRLSALTAVAAGRKLTHL